MAKKRKRRKRRSPPPAPKPEDGGQTAEAEAVDAPKRTRSTRRRPGDAPPDAPWGSFPLVELVVFLGIVLLVVGFIAGGNEGTIMIVGGLVLASLGGLELSIREHFSGYRSHTTLLAALAAVACLAVLFFGAPDLLSPYVRIAAALAVFGLSAWALTVVFRRASGGLAFRIRGFRG